MLPNTVEMQNVLMHASMQFLPELLVCAAIVLLLLLRVFRLAGRTHLGPVALVLTLGILIVAVCQWGGYGFELPDSSGRTLDVMFGGLLVYDPLTVFLRCFLLGFAVLMIWLTLLTGIPDREDSADFYCLLLGATLGMMLMASANHLLMVFIAVEMASLPSYALAGFLKGRRQSSEAALKYVVYGGGAAGVMLYGISLLAGKFGTGYLPDLAAAYSHAVGTFDPVLILGTLFLFIGVGFKLAAVPFHFWCPDVFEGASAEVAGFLSVASKAAALALLIRLVLTFTGVDPQVIGDGNWMGVLRYLLPALAVIAGLTATFGNLAAFFQNNLKRLLAYSTIAHAGYMMMGVCALTTPRLYLPGNQAVIGAGAVLFYLVAYLFMNLGAFAVVAFLRNQTGTEELDQMRGLVRRSPWMVVTLSLFLLSLLGIPPLIGFMAKFQIFYALWAAGVYYWRSGETGLGFTLLALLGVGGINSVISAVYYLRVMKVMIIEGSAEDLEGKAPTRMMEPAGNVFYATVMALVVIALGFAWNPLSNVSDKGVERFRPHPIGVASQGGPPSGTGAARGRPAAEKSEARGMNVIDPRTGGLLQQTFRRESLSMLRYIGEAFPWTVVAGHPALARVAEIVAEDRAATESLGRFLFRRRIPPSFSGAYPSGFTTMNFLSLEYLLPRLVETQRKAVADLESDVAAVTDADAKAELEKLLAVKQLHLSELEALKVPRGESTKV